MAKMRQVIFRGVLPACVTPFGPDGALDEISLARLLAYFEACGCSGVVVAGTNGEGPSLSAVEKRDLLKLAVKLVPKLQVILGIATPSLNEATWLAQQAGKAGAAAVLVMAPGYFRSAPEKGIVSWFLAVADASPIPVIAYNFPKYTGFTFGSDVVKALAKHPNIQGFKDSSGNRENLSMFRFMAPEASLFVGDETLLMDALKAEWQGSISGAGNLIPQWLVQVVKDYELGRDGAAVKFQIALRVIESIRLGVQPGLNKAVLAEWGLLGCGDVRLPLENQDGRELVQLIDECLGLHRENLGIPKRNCRE